MKIERAFEQIVADGQARRELLWLRAKEKGDDDDAADLERVDSEIVERLRASGLDLGDLSDDTREGRKRFGRLFDACYASHAASFVRVMASAKT